MFSPIDDLFMVLELLKLLFLLLEAFEILPYDVALLLINPSFSSFSAIDRAPVDDFLIEASFEA